MLTLRLLSTPTTQLGPQIGESPKQMHWINPMRREDPREQGTAPRILATTFNRITAEKLEQHYPKVLEESQLSKIYQFC